MLPGSLLRFSVRGDEVVPHFLLDNDLPWLRALVDERERFVGRRMCELEERLREPLPCASPAGKRTLASHVLLGLQGIQRRSAVPARMARAKLFGEAARSPSCSDGVLASVAASLRVTPEELGDSLFSDLPGESLIAPLEEPLCPGQLALRTNLLLTQALLFRATTLTIEAEGNSRALVRHAKLRGLICTVTRRGQPQVASLELSGPLSLFRRTLLYGRTLANLVPQLAWCKSFRLHAVCLLQGRSLALELRSGDPIFPGGEPRAYDSRLEERFARDFRRAAPDWDVVREPEPVAAGDTLVFPDFALQHRVDPSRRWLLELVGFWTPDYLARKLASYRAAGLSNLILCIDEERDCADGDLPPGALVLRFRRRVDAGALLRLIESPGHPASIDTCLTGS